MEDQNCFQEREGVLYYVHIYVGMDRFFWGGGVGVGENFDFNSFGWFQINEYFGV